MSIVLPSSEEELYLTANIVGYQRTAKAIQDIVLGDVKLAAADGFLVTAPSQMAISLTREWYDKVHNPLYQGPRSQIGLKLALTKRQTAGSGVYDISRVVRMSGLSR